MKPPPPIAEGTPSLPNRPVKRLIVSEIRPFGRKAAYLIIEIDAANYCRLIGLN